MEPNRIKRIVSYAVAISIIVAVVFVIANYVAKIDKRERVKELQADLLAVQAKVEILKGKNSVNKDENPLKGISVSKVAEKIDMAKKVFEKYEITGDDLAKYYILTNSDLEAMDLKNLVGKNKGSYIVNYDNYEVIYTEGYTNANGLYCHKVSEMNKQPEVQKVVPVSSNSVTATSEQASTQETKAGETNSAEETAKTAGETNSAEETAKAAEQTQTEVTATGAETTDTPAETTESTSSNEEVFRNILNHCKSIIK